MFKIVPPSLPSIECISLSFPLFPLCSLEWFCLTANSVGIAFVYFWLHPVSLLVATFCPFQVLINWIDSAPNCQTLTCCAHVKSLINNLTNYLHFGSLNAKKRGLHLIGSLIWPIIFISQRAAAFVVIIVIICHPLSSWFYQKLGFLFSRHVIRIYNSSLLVNTERVCVTVCLAMANFSSVMWTRLLLQNFNIFS